MAKLLEVHVHDTEADGVGLQRQRQAGGAQAVALEAAARQGSELQEQGGGEHQEGKAHEAAQEQRKS